jgi:hypothetical protein
VRYNTASANVGCVLAHHALKSWLDLDLLQAILQAGVQSNRFAHHKAAIPGARRGQMVQKLFAPVVQHELSSHSFSFMN